MATDKPNAEILVLYAPIILGTTPNVIPYTPVPPGEPVEGAPKHLFTPVLNQQGVLANAVTVRIDPPIRDGAGDDDISIALYLNGILLENRPIPPADRDNPSRFDLFELSLNDGINNKLEYKVHRPSNNVADSIPLWLIYSAELPGGNIVPGDDEHPYLDISLPPELGNPPVIGKDEVDKGVPLTLFYPYMKAYDVITVRLQNSDFPLPPLLPEEVGKPKVITVIRDVFVGIGSSPAFQFSYTVVDQVGNPTQRRRWSKILRADVDVDRIVDTTITSVTGSPSNLDIPNGGITTETTVILRGTAGKGRTVQVLDGGTLKGEPIADPTTGVWTLTVSGLTVAGHSFTARVGAGAPSTAWALTVTAVIVPTLTSVKGSPSNVEILENGITVETSLLLTGTASKGQPVEIFDGSGASAVSKGTVTANATTGIWQLTIAVAVGAHRLYAKSGYHPTPVFSNVRNLTVTAVEVPTLTSVKGSPSGVEILDNGITVETSLILTGTASKGQPVEIFDGSGASAVSKGTATANATTGIWQLTVAVAVGAHRLYAKSGYHPTPVFSNVRNLTVTAVVATTITSVKGSPSNVEIPNGDTTVETTVILTGAASKGQTVQVLDGTTLKGDPIANPSTGVWTLTVSGLTVAAHSFTARVGSGAASAARTLTVMVKLEIDSTPMILNGVKLLPAGNYGLQAREVPGNVATRNPTKGKPPYTYRSENPAIALVSSDGKVSGLKNGSTNIVVTDASNQSATYSVVVSGVYRYLFNNSYLTPAAAANWMRSVGAVELTNGFAPVTPTQLIGNFTNYFAIYGAVGIGHGRFVALNSQHQTYILRNSMWDNTQIAGSNVALTSSETCRSSAYIPT